MANVEIDYKNLYQAAMTRLAAECERSVQLEASVRVLVDRLAAAGVQPPQPATPPVRPGSAAMDPAR